MSQAMVDFIYHRIKPLYLLIQSPHGSVEKVLKMDISSLTSNSNPFKLLAFDSIQHILTYFQLFVFQVFSNKTFFPNNRLDREKIPLQALFDYTLLIFLISTLHAYRLKVLVSLTGLYPFHSHLLCIFHF